MRVVLHDGEDAPQSRAEHGVCRDNLAGGALGGTSRAVSRRRFLEVGSAWAGVLAIEGLLGTPSSAHARQEFTFGNPFTLGVASGDPSAHSVVLWTRLAPDPLNGGGMPAQAVPVLWELATDPHLKHVLRKGVAMAYPEFGHSIRIWVGALPSNTWLWYRFRAGVALSAIGRTRTFPTLGEPASEMRFALCSCQNFQNGFYSAYRNMAHEELDFVAHVGDYIYEGGVDLDAIRQHNSAEVKTLEAYRNRYALYKLDADLQAAHAAFPFITTWDDHEVDNNYAGFAPEGSQRIGEFVSRRAAAYQAYFEHMPLGPLSRPVGPFMWLFRSFNFGDLAAFQVLDTRQFRTDQPCGDNFQFRCAEALNPFATMTGPQQEQWLFQQIERTRARWNVIAQQVMMMPWDLSGLLNAQVPLLNMDAWDGYSAARSRLLSHLAWHRPFNNIVLSGDIHSAWAANLQPDFYDAGSPIVASEFVTTSISSRFPVGLIPLVESTLPDNPHVKFFNGDRRGYLRFTVTRDEFRADYRVVESVLDSNAPVATLKSFVVRDGVPGLQEA